MLTQVEAAVGWLVEFRLWMIQGYGVIAGICTRATSPPNFVCYSLFAKQ